MIVTYKRIELKKGFTLVELIVVIAIIAIIAAVSLVGFNQFIDRARESNDVTDVGNMNKVLSAYYVQNGITDYTELDASDIRYIVNIDNDYSFIPRVDTYSFIYDQATGRVELSSADDVMALKNGQTRLLDDSIEYGNIESISENHLLLDTGGSSLADTLYGIRNLYDLDSFSTYIESLDEYDEYRDIQESLDQFNPENGVMYINDFFSITPATTTEITRIVFSDQIETIPTLAMKPGFNYQFEAIVLPKSTSIIETKAFIHLPDEVRMEHDNLNEISVEEDAFADTTVNSSLKSREGTVSLFELNIVIDRDANATYKYLKRIEDGENVTYRYHGKRIDIGIVVNNENEYMEFEYFAFDHEDNEHDAGVTYYESDGSFYTDYTDTEGTKLNDPDLLSVFNKNGYIEQINHNDRVTVDVVSSEGNPPEVARLAITYFTISGKQYISIKTYDSEGNLFAKGYCEFFRQDGIVYFE
jgi:prepilin-type N-terminal cleavage/methylation domain-containing protein